MSKNPSDWYLHCKQVKTGNNNALPNQLLNDWND